MPYMTIYKTKDGKYHSGDCELLKDGYIDSQVIGSMATKPEPKREDMCHICFAVLFKE